MKESAGTFAVLCAVAMATGCATVRVYDSPATAITAALHSLGAEDAGKTAGKRIMIQRMPAIGMRNQYEYVVSPIDASHTELSVNFSSRPDPIWLYPLCIFDPSDVFFSRSKVEKQRHAQIQRIIEEGADVEQRPEPYR